MISKLHSSRVYESETWDIDDSATKEYSGSVKETFGVIDDKAMLGDK